MESFSERLNSADPAELAVPHVSVITLILIQKAQVKHAGVDKFRRL